MIHLLVLWFDLKLTLLHYYCCYIRFFIILNFKNQKHINDWPYYSLIQPFMLKNSIFSIQISYVLPKQSV